MSNAFQLSVYQQSYLLNKKVYQLTRKFPRGLKYTLGQQFFNSCLKLTTQIVKANQSGIKQTKIAEAISEVEILYTYSRMSEDLKAITIGEFRVLSENLSEISSQLKSWSHWDKKQNKC